MAPPPPVCLPFGIGRSKPKRRLSWSSSGTARDYDIRHQSYSQTSTMNDAAESVTFHSDSERYDEIPMSLPEFQGTDSKGRPKLHRGNTMTGTKKSAISAKFGYGWGIGKKNKMKQAEAEEEGEFSGESSTNLPVYEAPTAPPTRSNTKASQDSKWSHDSHYSDRARDFSKPQDSINLRRGDSKRSQVSQNSHHRSLHSVRTQDSPKAQDSINLRRGDSQRSRASQNTHRSPISTQDPPKAQDSLNLKRGESQRSQDSKASRATHSSHASRSTHRSAVQAASVPGTSQPRQSIDSYSTLVGSALERKMNEVDSVRYSGDTTERLEDLRRHMATQKLDY